MHHVPNFKGYRCYKQLQASQHRAYQSHGCVLAAYEPFLHSNANSQLPERQTPIKENAHNLYVALQLSALELSYFHFASSKWHLQQRTPNQTLSSSKTSMSWSLVPDSVVYQLRWISKSWSHRRSTGSMRPCGWEDLV